MFLESNMQVIRNDHDIILTITGTYLGGKILNIFAYSNEGKIINLSLSEEIQTENILAKSWTK